MIRDAIKRAYPDHGIHGEEHGREAGTSPLHVGDRPDRRHQELHPGPASLGRSSSRCTTARRPWSASRTSRSSARRSWARPAARRNGGAATSERTLRTRPCPRDRGRDRRDHRPAPVSRRRRSRRALQAVADRARFLRYGGDCYCYTQLAMGFVDVVIENGLQPYDVQALMPDHRRRRRGDHQLDGRPLRPGRAGAGVRRSGAAQRQFAAVAARLKQSPTPDAAPSRSLCLLRLRCPTGLAMRRPAAAHPLIPGPEIGARNAPPWYIFRRCNMTGRCQCLLLLDSRSCASLPTAPSTPAKTWPRRWG